MGISISKSYANMPFKEFEKWHKKKFAHDDKTAKERYVELGGKLPKEKE